MTALFPKMTQRKLFASLPLGLKRETLECFKEMLKMQLFNIHPDIPDQGKKHPGSNYFVSGIREITFPCNAFFSRLQSDSLPDTGLLKNSLAFTLGAA